MFSFKQKKSLFFLMFLPMFVMAQGPNNTGTYYKSANGYKGEALKTALHNIIKNPRVTSYKGLWSAYKKGDVRSDGCIWDIYSATNNFVPGGSAQGKSASGEGQGYNREHTMPKSWFNDASPMISDYVMVRPSDTYLNSYRSNDPYGETDGNTFRSHNDYCKVGNCTYPGYNGRVFEPGDDMKGDLARIYFYMATCYEDRISNWSSVVMSHDKYKPYVKWQMDMLMKWSKEDPVDEREKARNKVVQEIQGNRNPFVDYPGLEEYIWGENVNTPFSYDGNQSGEIEQETVIYEESFAQSLGKFTIEDKELTGGLNYVWKYYNNTKLGVQCAKGSAYIKNANQKAESWLVSPVIDLTSWSGARLDVDQVTHYLNGNKAGKFLSVRIKVADNAWEKLNIEVPTMTTSWSFVPTAADLTAYAGKKIQIAFKYTSTTSCAPTWELQNFKITGNVTESVNKVYKTPTNDDRIYNLSGQQVNPSYKGIVIKNNKKYWNK